MERENGVKRQRFCLLQRNRTKAETNFIVGLVIQFSFEMNFDISAHRAQSRGTHGTATRCCHLNPLQGLSQIPKTKKPPIVVPNIPFLLQKCVQQISSAIDTRQSGKRDKLTKTKQRRWLSELSNDPNVCGTKSPVQEETRSRNVNTSVGWF